MEASAREAIAASALSLSSADQTEVLVLTGDNSLARFTHESIHQQPAGRDTVISVRAVVDNRTGVARTNAHGEEALRRVVEQAITLARLAPEDALQPRLPGGGATTAPPRAFIEATADAQATARAQMCDAIFTVAQENGLWCAGFASTGSAGYTVANSSGARASFDGTDACLNAKMIAPDSSGFAEDCDADVGQLDAQRAAEVAARKALDTAHPRAVEPGAWTVILQPPAFAELLDYLVPHFSAQSFDEGSSFCSDGLDRTYFADNVTIRDDYAHPLAPSMPFDFEGQPKERIALVENGVVRNIVTDSYWANKLSRPNTGHALPAPNARGPFPLNTVVDGGSASEEELIASTRRGLLVSRFWYIRIVDQKRAIVTGMTRDGTYLIENGKLTGGVRNLRFNQSILEALRNCEFSSTQKRSQAYGYSRVVPTAKIENFAFTSTTEF
jgi:predicted Zn-dependent protease